MSGSRRDFRYDRKEHIWMGRCPSCSSAGQSEAWWPLTLEFWDPASGLRSCRACQRLHRRKLRVQTAEERRAKQRAYYHAHRAAKLAWRHDYHAANREEINRKRREAYAAAKHAGDLPGLWDG